MKRQPFKGFNTLAQVKVSALCNSKAQLRLKWKMTTERRYGQWNDDSTIRTLNTIAFPFFHSLCFANLNFFAVNISLMRGDYALRVMQLSSCWYDIRQTSPLVKYAKPIKHSGKQDCSSDTLARINGLRRTDIRYYRYTRRNSISIYLDNYTERKI